jgi:protein-disulfide isomerase
MQLRRFFVILTVAFAVAFLACGPAQEKPALTPAPVASGGGAPIAVADGDAGAPKAVVDDGPIPVLGDDPQSGDRDALVTIVEFVDLQCPFCSRADATLTQIMAARRDVRIVWKNSPLTFHDQARPLAEAARGVFELGGEAAFWSFVHYAFQHQQEEREDGVIARWGDRAGVDGRALEEGVRSKRWAERIDRDLALGKQIGVNGTPVFYINGTEVSGAQPADKFNDVIDRELANAKKLLDVGVPRDRLYAAAVVSNRKLAAVAATEKKKEPDEEDTKVWRVPVGKSPVRGSATALVTVVEFGDFQCPFCKRAEETLKQVQAKYGDKVRLVWKDEPLPFHVHAEAAAELARYVRAQKGDAAFWDAHDRLFATAPAFEDSDFERVATAMGVDAKKALAAMHAKKYGTDVGEDADLADDLQASGTPHFFINGKRLVGAQPLEKFSEVVDAEFARADALVKSGTAPASVYDAIIAKGQGAPEPERKTVALNPDAPWEGAANARVVIQEFADFQCPFCKRADATLDEVMKTYGTRVKIVWRQLPLPMHPDAGLAAEVALEVRAQKGNPAFFRMKKMMLEHQTLDRASLEGYAKELGVDMKKLATAIDNHTHRAEIEHDAQAAQSAGITGTPAFVVNGYFISGAQPYAKFHKIIERALNEPARH